MAENGFLNQAYVNEGALGVQCSSDCIVVKSLVGSWPLIPVLWTYMKVVRNYRVCRKSMGMKSNSCSSVDINAIVCSTYVAAPTCLTLYSLLFQSVAVCMFSDIGNLVCEYKVQCVSHLCEYELMKFKWIYRPRMIKISQQTISVMKSMEVTVMLVAQRTVKGCCKASLHSILTKQGILINKNWI